MNRATWMSPGDRRSGQNARPSAAAASSSCGRDHEGQQPRRARAPPRRHERNANRRRTREGAACCRLEQPLRAPAFPDAIDQLADRIVLHA
jgi:hypothetical protein